MNRRVFLAGGLAFLGAPLAGEAQPATRRARIGILSVGRTGAGAQGAGTDTEDAFGQSLRNLGWIEGRNAVVERRYSGGREERLPDLAAELVQANVDVILAAGGPASLSAARHATQTVPIVMVASSRDPIGEGLIQSYARPGGNVTGIATAPEELTGKQLELLKGLDPAISRIGVLWDATTGAFRVGETLAQMRRGLGVELLPFEVRAPDDFGAAVAAAARERVGGLIVVGSPMFIRNRQQIAQLLMKDRLPGISVWSAFADAGLLMAYGPDLADEFRRAAVYVDKILRGARPGDLPVERPTKFELVINVKTADTLGLAIPRTLLLRADHLIQ